MDTERKLCIVSASIVADKDAFAAYVDRMHERGWSYVSWAHVLFGNVEVLFDRGPVAVIAEDFRVGDPVTTWDLHNDAEDVAPAGSEFLTALGYGGEPCGNDDEVPADG